MVELGAPPTESEGGAPPAESRGGAEATCGVEGGAVHQGRLAEAGRRRTTRRGRELRLSGGGEKTESGRERIRPRAVQGSGREQRGVAGGRSLAAGGCGGAEGQ